MQEKQCCVALSDRPYSKIKIKKGRVGKPPNFAQIGCFLRKMMEYAPKFGPFGCFLKKLFKKKITDRPTQLFQKSHLRATQQFFFLA